MPTVGDIARLIGAAPPAEARDAERAISGVAALSDAQGDQISFVASEQYARQVPTTRAGAVVAKKSVRLEPPPGLLVLVADDVDLAIARTLELFAPSASRLPAGVDPAARVSASATLAEGVCIGPFVFVGERVRIGRRTTLHPGVYIGDDAVIGEDCLLFPNVVLRERVRLGDRVVIHANSAVGSDGFGYRWDGARHAKVPQIGAVVIEDDVEIGSCTCIDRAKFGFTRVGAGSKIDNLVQIAHNVTIGPHCIIVGQAGIAGSSTLGVGVVLGGQTAVRDHTTLGDRAMAAACSGVAEDVAPKAIVSGTPALPHRQSLREQAALRRLPDVVVQVRKLQEQLAELQARLGNADSE